MAPGDRPANQGDAAASVSCARALRLAGGWRVSEVAASAGLSEQAVRQVERGQVIGKPLRTLVKLAEALGVSVAELVPALGIRPPESGLKRHGF